MGRLDERNKIKITYNLFLLIFVYVEIIASI